MASLGGERQNKITTLPDNVVYADMLYRCPHITQATTHDPTQEKISPQPFGHPDALCNQNDEAGHHLCLSGPWV